MPTPTLPPQPNFFFVDLGDRNDRFRVTAALATVVEGNAGNDRLVGSRKDSRAEGGPDATP